MTDKVKELRRIAEEKIAAIHEKRENYHKRKRKERMEEIAEFAESLSAEGLIRYLEENGDYRDEVMIGLVGSALSHYFKEGAADYGLMKLTGLSAERLNALSREKKEVALRYIVDRVDNVPLEKLKFVFHVNVRREKEQMKDLLNGEEHQYVTEDEIEHLMRCYKHICKSVVVHRILNVPLDIAAALKEVTRIFSAVGAKKMVNASDLVREKKIREQFKDEKMISEIKGIWREWYQKEKPPLLQNDDFYLIHECLYLLTEKEIDEKIEVFLEKLEQKINKAKISPQTSTHSLEEAALRLSLMDEWKKHTD